MALVKKKQAFTGAAVAAALAVFACLPGSNLPGFSTTAGPAQQRTDRIEDHIAALNGGSSDEKQRAAVALGNARDPRGVEPLIKALRSSDDFVRNFAATALGKIGDPRALEPLVQALSDTHMLVRRAAAQALGSLRLAGAVEPLVKALETDEFLVQRCAAEALGDIGDASAVAPLIRALKSSDSFVRDGAANALVKIGNPAVDGLVAELGSWQFGPTVAGILKELRWSPKTKREQVLFAVAQRNRQSLMSDWDTVKEVLASEARNGDAARSLNAVSALIGIGRPETIEVLLAALAQNGTEEMAGTFLTSGDARLAEAAQDWARSRGIELGKNGEPSVRWGEIPDKGENHAALVAR